MTILLVSAFPSTHETYKGAFSGHWAKELIEKCALGEGWQGWNIFSKERNEREPKEWTGGKENNPTYGGKPISNWMVGELEEFYKRLRKLEPSLIITFGPVALWALTGNEDLHGSRGTRFEYHGIPVWPTLHPSMIDGQFATHTTIRSDVRKALKYRNDPAPAVLIQVPETPEEAIKLLEGLPDQYACDIETAKGMIDCIGFGVKDRAFVIPFFLAGKGARGMEYGPAYWTREEYRWVMQAVKAKLETGPMGWWDHLPDRGDAMEGLLYD